MGSFSMMQVERKGRVIFLDLLRVLAVFMMVQGHTVDILLSDQYRDYSNPVFIVWEFFRGLTAPIFLFTSGTVFIYLFRSSGERFNQNPRVLKGIKRFLLLVTIGYLLRYPTAELTNFAFVTEESWKIFFAVDVLQLIGFSLLFLLLAAYIGEKFKFGDASVFAFAAFFFFAAFPFFDQIPWSDYLPLPIAGYFYAGSGSNFPLFPWSGFVMCGGVLGSYLASQRESLNPAKLSLWLSLCGIGFLSVYEIINWAGTTFGGENYFGTVNPGLAAMRLGIVLLITSLLSLIAIKINSIPQILKLVGRNTLLIYVVHLVILYGSAWNSGFGRSFERSFNFWQTIVAALLMLTSMVGLVILVNRGSTFFKNTISLPGRYYWR